MPPVLRQTPCHRHVLMAVWPAESGSTHPMLRRLSVLAALLLLASCAAVPGYIAPAAGRQEAREQVRQGARKRRRRRRGPLRDERHREGDGLQAPDRLDPDRHNPPERPLGPRGAIVRSVGGAESDDSPVFGGSAQAWTGKAFPRANAPSSRPTTTSLPPRAARRSTSRRSWQAARRPEEILGA